MAARKDVSKKAEAVRRLTVQVQPDGAGVVAARIQHHFHPECAFSPTIERAVPAKPLDLIAPPSAAGTADDCGAIEAEPGNAASETMPSLQ